MFYIMLSLVFALSVAAEIYDVIKTEKGIKAGLGVEAFDWLVGPKPSALALYLRDFPILMIVAAPALVFSFVNMPLAWGALAGPLAAAARHIQGGRSWAKVIASGKPFDPNSGPGLSAWQKFWN